MSVSVSIPLCQPASTCDCRHDRRPPIGKFELVRSAICLYAMPDAALRRSQLSRQQVAYWQHLLRGLLVITPVVFYSYPRICSNSVFALIFRALFSCARLVTSDENTT